MTKLEMLGLVDQSGDVTLEGWQIFSELLDHFEALPHSDRHYPLALWYFRKIYEQNSTMLRRNGAHKR